MENNKYEEFSKSINKLIDDFKSAKEKYYKIYIFFHLTSIICSCLSTIFISLTFVENCEVVFKILSVITAGIATAVIAANKMIDFKEKWIQRTETLIKLLKIKRAIKFRLNVENDPIKKDELFSQLLLELDEVMKEDFSHWEETTDNEEK